MDIAKMVPSATGASRIDEAFSGTLGRQRGNPAFAESLKQTPSVELAVELRAEADEFWNFVGKKLNQRWTWDALDRASGRILAYQIGKRTDEMRERLIEELAIFPIRCYYTDNWQSYSKAIPSSQHQIGKDNT